METKRIKIMASYDWSMRSALSQFLKFLDLVIHYQGKEYRLEFGHIIARPIVCGENLTDADFVIDRTTHWNDYYKYWAQQAINSGIAMINHTNTFFTYDKHIAYDILARVMHPDDHLPTTLLLPQFHPYTEDQERQKMWKSEQELIMENTKLGFDERRRETDWKTVGEKMRRNYHYEKLGKVIRAEFYDSSQYLKDVVEKYFHNKFPLYLKKACGGGGADVYKIESLEDLYRKYDEKCEKAFHLQEAVVDYDIFIRCLALGPQVLPMRFLPDTPLHEHYGSDRPRLDPVIQQRMIAYSLFVNSYHRWTYNSLEAFVKGGQISPIDFANACPDTHFTSLHVHFPWAICAILRWCAFCAVTGHDMRIDLEQKDYLKIVHDPTLTQLQKHEMCIKKSQEYFAIDRFREFCEENFPDIKERMIQFYDTHFDGIIRTAIRFYEFPEHEHERFYHHYKGLMENIFRPNAMEYLTAPAGF